jgi:hypothetical protein
VRDVAHNLTTLINYNAISTRRATIIDAPVFQDRELVVRSLNAAEAETFIVIVSLWISEVRVRGNLGEESGKGDEN